MEVAELERAIGQARKGIAQYLEIMELLPKVNVSENRDFQRKFNAFYRVRQRTAGWYAAYYGYMQECRTVRPVPTFDDVLDHFWRVMGRCEASFASKLVATIDPQQPVWDAFVLKNTGVTPPAYASDRRLMKVKAAYRQIQEWYRKFLATEEGGKVIQKFNAMVCEYARITDLKKVDFVLWQSRS